jgi:hypothetical protein
MSKQITLTKGQFAIVDDEDYDFINQWKWTAVKNKNGNWYALRQVRVDKHSVYVYMHRQIMNTPSDLVVDHIDHNGLNNQKDNLRNCTQKENLRNRLRKRKEKKVFIPKELRIVSYQYKDRTYTYYIPNIKINGRYVERYTDKEKALASYRKQMQLIKSRENVRQTL